MSKDTEIKGNTQFKKKPHRPWKLALLKEALIEEEEVTYPENLIPQALSAELADLSKNLDAEDSEFPDLSMDLEDPSETFIYSQPAMEEPVGQNLRDVYDVAELQKIIAAKLVETQELTHKIEEQPQPQAQLTIGGFFNPGSLAVKFNSTVHDPVDNLMGVLRLKEEELSKLTKNLELQRAIEESEHALLAKDAAMKAKQLAEERTKQAIEQAEITKQQLQIAIEQTKVAEAKLTEEWKIRKLLERKLDELGIQTHNLETKLSTEKMLHKDAEVKLRVSLDQVLANEVAKKTIATSQQDLLARVEKLQAIIASEQDLRKIADRKYQQTLADLQNLEKSRIEEVTQRRMQRQLFMDMLQEK